MIKTQIQGHNGAKANVTTRGQLVTAPLDFSLFYDATAGVADTPVEVVPAKSNMCFVITAMVIYANKNVGAGDATVRLYEADGSAEAYDATTDATIFLQEMVKQTSIVMTGLNIIVGEGKWLNGVTNDDDVFFNIAGYYVDA